MSWLANILKMKQSTKSGKKECTQQDKTCIDNHVGVSARLSFQQTRSSVLLSSSKVLMIRLFLLPNLKWWWMHWKRKTFQWAMFCMKEKVMVRDDVNVYKKDPVIYWSGINHRIPSCWEYQAHCRIGALVLWSNVWIPCWRRWRCRDIQLPQRRLVL